MSLSLPHGIFLLKGASSSSSRNGAAMGQNKGLGLEDACVKLWVYYLTMSHVQDSHRSACSAPRYNGLPGVTQTAVTEPEWEQSVSSVGPDPVVTVTTRLNISPQLLSLGAQQTMLWCCIQTGQ